jgi:hypothetical protein
MSTRRRRGPLVGLRYRLGDGDRPGRKGVRVRRAAIAGIRICRAVSSIGTKPSSRTSAPGCDQPTSGRTRTALRRSNADRRQRTSGGCPLHRPPQRDRLSGRPPSSGPPKARNDRSVAPIMSARAPNRIISDRTGSRGAERPVQQVSTGIEKCTGFGNRKVLRSLGTRVGEAGEARTGLGQGAVELERRDGGAGVTSVPRSRRR